MQAGDCGDLCDLPDRENLERVDCAAFARTHPLRHRAVAAWLRDRPEPAGKPAKAMNWSIMASWFADGGCAEFLRHAVWRDQAMCGQLRTGLMPSGLAAVEARLRGA